MLYNNRDIDNSVYYTWVEMRRRCRDENRKDYKYYGGCGIVVCERWENFENFEKDMGPKPTPKHTIDRINKDGNYEPTNCRWVTKAENNKNRRRWRW